MTKTSLESLIINNRYLSFTILSILSTVLVLYNSLRINQAILGIISSAVYIAINAVFLGHIFFNDESTLLRLTFGVFVLLMLVVLVNVPLVLLNQFNLITNVLSLGAITIVVSIVNHKVKSSKTHGRTASE